MIMVVTDDKCSMAGYGARDGGESVGRITGTNHNDHE